jgi:3-hydroxyisobutyrate dehydrogenase
MLLAPDGKWDQRVRCCFVGAGLIGAPMVVSLRRAGLDVTVYDPWSRYADKLVAVGAHFAPNLGEAATAADIVAVCVVNDAQVLELAQGADGVLENLPVGGTFIVHSSIRPETSRELAALCAAKGVRYLDVMVSGYPYKAEASDLTLMVGGDRETFEECREYLDALGSRQFFLGPAGAGAAAKLINNVMANAAILATYDALNLARLNGIPVETMIDVASVCSGSSDALVQWRAQGWHHGPENRPTELLGLNALGGMRLALEDARSYGWDLPIVSALVDVVTDLQKTPAEVEQ